MSKLKDTGQTTANDVADFFLWFCHDHGDVLTNLKLQKLVYYAQAWFLALYHKLLFAERIEAWVHGPVVPELYRRFKPYKWNAIAERVKRPSLPEKIEKHLLEVLDAYGRFSAWELERLTHSELPWMDARKGLSIEENGSRTIGPEAMRDFYQKLATRG